MSADSFDQLFRLVHALPDDPDLLVRVLRLNSAAVRKVVERGALEESERRHAEVLLGACKNAEVATEQQLKLSVEKLEQRMSRQFRRLDDFSSNLVVGISWRELVGEHLSAAFEWVHEIAVEVVYNVLAPADLLALPMSGQVSVRDYVKKILAPDSSPGEGEYGPAHHYWAAAVYSLSKERGHIDTMEYRVFEALGFISVMKYLSEDIPSDSEDRAALVAAFGRLWYNLEKVLPNSRNISKFAECLVDVQMLCALAESDETRPPAQYDVLPMSDIVAHAIGNLPPSFRDRIGLVKEGGDVHVSNRANVFCEAIMLLVWAGLRTSRDIRLDVSFGRDDRGSWVWIQFDNAVQVRSDRRGAVAERLINDIHGRLESDDDRHALAIHVANRDGGPQRRKKEARAV